MEETINFELSTKDVNVVVAALGELPAKVSNNTLNKVIAIVQRHEQEKRAAQGNENCKENKADKKDKK